MSRRLRDLTPPGPAAVPLPNGTEVGTLVGREVDGRLVPAGAVGRVVAAREGGFDVRLVGAGVGHFAAHELVARKAGQARYASRRAASWGALRPCVVLETIVGSRAWGLADADSDTDVRGVFALPLGWSSGLGAPPTDLVSLDGSATYWEFGKTVRQALRADPNTFETLFVPSARPLDPIGAWLLEARDAFVSAEIYGSFGRYALSQLKRVLHALRLAEHREVVLGWLRDRPSLSLDEVAARLAPVARARADSDAEALAQAKEYVKQLYRSLFDQGLLVARDLASLAAFARAPSVTLATSREVRPKNAYNLLRLLDLAVTWLREGRPRFEATGEFRQVLIAVKRGEVPLDEVKAYAERLTPALEAARRATPLPPRPDVARADELLRRVSFELARRAITREPGPLGRDAPEPPPVAWEPAQADDPEDPTGARAADVAEAAPHAPIAARTGDVTRD